MTLRVLSTGGLRSYHKGGKNEGGRRGVRNKLNIERVLGQRGEKGVVTLLVVSNLLKGGNGVEMRGREKGPKTGSRLLNIIFRFYPEATQGLLRT